MERKIIIRTVVLVILIILALFYFTTKKEDSIEQELLDIELIILLLLSVVYTFTYESPLWKRYGWIWKSIFIITLIAYLFRVAIDHKRGWWNKVVSTTTLIFVLLAKEVRYSRNL